MTVKPGGKIFESTGVLTDDHILLEGAQNSLLILQRNGHLFADILSSSTTGEATTSCTREDILKAIHDRKLLRLNFQPSRARNKSASGGAAIFVSMFCEKTGRRYKKGFTCVGWLGLDGKMYEVSILISPKYRRRGGAGSKDHQPHFQTTIKDLILGPPPSVLLSC